MILDGRWLMVRWFTVDGSRSMVDNAWLMVDGQQLPVTIHHHRHKLTDDIELH